MNKNIFFLLTAFLISAPCWAASDGMSEAERTRLIQLSVGRAFEGVLGAVVTNGEPLEDAIEGLVGNISHSPQPEDVYFDLQALRAFIQQQIDAAWQNMKDHGLTLDRLELRSDQPDVGLHVVHALRKYDAGLSEIERNARRDADAIKEALADLERVAQSRPATSDPVPSSVTPPSTDTSSDEAASQEEIDAEAAKTLLDVLEPGVSLEGLPAVQKAVLAARAPEGEFNSAARKALVEEAVREMNSGGSGRGSGDLSREAMGRMNRAEHEELVNRAAVRLLAGEYGIPLDLVSPAPRPRTTTPTPFRPAAGEPVSLSQEGIDTAATLMLTDTVDETEFTRRRRDIADAEYAKIAILYAQKDPSSAGTKLAVEEAIRETNRPGDRTGSVEKAALRILAGNLGVSLSQNPASPRITPPLPGPATDGSRPATPPVTEKWYQRLLRHMNRMPDKKGGAAALLTLFLLIHGGDSWATSSSDITHYETLRDNARLIIESKHGVMTDEQLRKFVRENAAKMSGMDKLRIGRYFRLKDDISEAKRRRKWARWETLAGGLLGAGTAVRHYRQFAAAA